MSSKVRSLARGIARYNIGQQDTPIFGKYAPVTMRVRNKRTKKLADRQVMRSYFGRAWRSWL